MLIFIQQKIRNLVVIIVIFIVFYIPRTAIFYMRVKLVNHFTKLYIHTAVNMIFAWKKIKTPSSVKKMIVKTPKVRCLQDV
jgi:hypothetical protein